MKTRFLLPVLVLAGCGALRQNSVTEEFQVAVSLQREEDFSKYAEQIKSNFSLRTNIAVEKIKVKTEKLKGDFSVFYRTYSDIEFNGLSEKEFGALKNLTASALPPALRESRHIPYTPNAGYNLIDFLPPAEQALVKHNFYQQSYEEFAGQENFEGSVLANCWSTTYEIVRLATGGQPQYHIFYIGTSAMTEVLNNQNWFYEVETFGIKEAPEKLLQADPLDVFAVYQNGELKHSAVVAAPGILFEKTGLASEAYYRLFHGETFKKGWPAHSLVKWMRPSRQRLPEPEKVLSGVDPSKNRSFENSYFYFGKVAPFEASPQMPWRAQLPESAYRQHSFRFL